MEQTSFRSGVTGVVLRFDNASGDGTVAALTGEEWPFHCTQIMGGARNIRAETAIAFDVVAGLPGRWEATRLRARSPEAFLCPVCAGVIDGSTATYEICAMCGWEDDPVQRDDSAMPVGANLMSLDEARRAIGRKNE